MESVQERESYHKGQEDANNWGDKQRKRIFIIPCLGVAEYSRCVTWGREGEVIGWV